jgi:hypothetical protein
MRRHLSRGLGIAAIAMTALLIPATAGASPPLNDDFANATVVPSLPFSDSVITTDATTEAGEPGGGCFYSGQTVWYAFTPASDGTFRVDTSASNYTNVINIYSGSSLNTLSFAGCGYSFQSPTFHASGGTSYYIQVGDNYSGGGQLGLNVSQVPPPTNDAFAAASVIDPAALPYNDAGSGLAATLEPSEPVASCNPFGTPNNSWWYSFTPTVTRSYTVSTSSGGQPTVAVYTGSALGSLTEQACRALGGSNAFSFAATAGTTYRIQVGDYYAGAFGGVNFSLDVAPNPVAGFFYSPSDPSPYEGVQFYDNSSDPGGNSVTRHWDFGDGTSLTDPGSFPTHQFPADGTYDVTLTVTSTDGRIASTTQTIQVRTHDVAVAKLTVPQSASVGQTRPITVGLANHRYPETVRVDLMKSVAGGSFVNVGSLTLSVPVRSGNRTTDFKLSYTFASADAVAGKLSFQAVATIIDARDALPADNVVTSLPTKVNA